MWTIVQYSLSKAKAQILGWGLSLAGLGALVVPFYDIFVDQQEQFAKLMEAYPPEFMAFFGGDDLSAFTTPEGFLGVEFFSLMPILLGIFAVLAGSGLLASDEESGRLDLIMAQPISRAGLFFGRLLAHLIAAIAILLLSYLGLTLAASNSNLGLGFAELFSPFVSLLATVLVFSTMALLLSQILPSRRLAAMAAGIVLVVSYFVTSLSNLSEELEIPAKFSPLTYYQGGDAIKELNLEWLAGLLLAAIIFTGLAWWRFRVRDIRVGGEGGWRIPFIGRNRHETPASA